MRVIEVSCKIWLLNKWIKGITLYPFIFYQGMPNDTLRRHEWTHIEQIREVGVIKFYFLYLKEYFIDKKEYQDISFEKEAYGKQTIRYWAPWENDNVK